MCRLLAAISVVAISFSTHASAQALGSDAVLKRLEAKVDALDGARDENAFASILEFSVGPQWKTPVAGVGDFFVRVTADAQYWQSVSNFTPVTMPSGLVHNDYSGGFGFWGVSAAIGISR